MKKILLALAFIITSAIANAQCTTGNATGCQCKVPGQTDCDLLPDIQIGHPPFYVYDDDFGVKEFSQSGNADPNDDGRLYVTVSTPNTGFGPLELVATTTFVCGTDTFQGTAPAMCPNGIDYPKIIINQRIYHKNGNTMTHYDRPAGTMTYHPTHNHMHVDNWGNYTLRTRDSLEANPLNWPIIGSGTKLAFCVEDYGTCPGYPDHCLDSAGNPLNQSSDFPNYGLGGGNYGCSASIQGISSGYDDIYWTTLTGMYITIPPGTCNGDYYIVCEVDPNHNFLEEDETNNYYAAPITLHKQNPDSLSINVNVFGSKFNFCQGESVVLSPVTTSGMGTISYHWSNGDTTQATNINTSGSYTVDVTNQCGTGTSMPVQLTMYTSPADPSGINDTIPVPGVAVVNANSPNHVVWYDQAVGGSALGTGNAFITPFINVSTTYYAEAEEVHLGATFNSGLPDNTSGGVGGDYNGDQSMIFNCYNPFVLHSVKVYALNAANMNIILYDNNNTVVQSVPVSVVPGMNVLTLDIPVARGLGYSLTRTGGFLYRNNPTTNVGYPFIVSNVLSITSSSQGVGYYYFFYDWDIRLPDNSCTSNRIPVEAVVSAPDAIADVAVLNSLVVYPNPAKNSVKISFRAVDPNTTIELIDALGRIVLKKDIRSDSDMVEESLNVGNLSRGFYNIHILSSGKNFYKRLVLN